MAVMDTASRIAWLRSFPAQSIVLAEQSQCCAAITKALESNTAATALSQLHDSVEAQIDCLTRILQANTSVVTSTVTADAVVDSNTTTDGSGNATAITDSLKITVGALITVWCHTRDVISSLIAAKANSTSDFEWQKQLRYTWITPNSNTASTTSHTVAGNTIPSMGYGHSGMSMMHTMIHTSGPSECNIYQNDAHFVHDHEYIGNTSRLVMTPLTDACYLAITSALHASTSVVIGGHTGSGKHYIIQVHETLVDANIYTVHYGRRVYS
jgi:Hydrolytic ATP binding site of dynein motor region